MKKLDAGLTISNNKAQQISNVPSMPNIPPVPPVEWTPGVNMPPLKELELAELRSSLITMIRKICRLSKLTDISGELLNDTINDWVEIIGNELKAENVQPAYVLAMRIRNSSFPLQPYELLNAHKQIVAARPVVTKGTCPYCRNTGTMKVFNPSTKIDEIVPCIGAMHERKSNDN